MKSRKPLDAKAVGLLSGGLDSILACRMMLEQEIEVVAVNFTSPFCTCTRKGCRHQASKVAEELSIPIKLLPTGQDYIAMVKHPKHGRGSGMNPCIDCRIFTFSRARAYADEIGASFVFTGEVLGERPMSQHLRALKLIEAESGLQGRLLRPLSALLLEPTKPELEGIVDRSRLKAIRGRSRKPQMEMAEGYCMTDYPCPAGGCLLTDKQFATRLKDAFAHGEDTPRDMEFLKLGRHFRLPSGAKVIVGRNETENELLGRLAQDEDERLEAEDFVGPLTILRSLMGTPLRVVSPPANDAHLAARICGRYCDGQEGAMIRISCGGLTLEIEPMSDAELAQLRVGEKGTGVRGWGSGVRRG